MAVQLQSAIFLISWSLLNEYVATTFSQGLAALTASKPYWSIVFLVGSISNSIKEANATVTSIREEATANKCGHYHHLSASVRAVICKYASGNFNFAQLVGVFEIVIAEILWPYKNSGLIKNFSRRKFLAIQFVLGGGGKAGFCNYYKEGCVSEIFNFCNNILLLQCTSLYTRHRRFTAQDLLQAAIVTAMPWYKLPPISVFTT